MPRFERVGNFEVNRDRAIGNGGFGVVYYARDVSHSPPAECAAKMMVLGSLCQRESVEHEVACMRLVGGHPTIIKFLHYQEAPHARGEAWVFLELATGRRCMGLAHSRELTRAFV
uniref:non-specific serine/threonine protein kinase n=1 Tax=Calcidiscus leptoporus TaxID=127549 RepID=A0A7S0NTV6_9EUKA|mmetsp:Transcript_24345/g.56601  ORF Transcript_24345/g.56601 Transcript_24345/m.56601 type:complete len:115 (+) Transcript_24345:114-458(+)